MGWKLKSKPIKKEANKTRINTFFLNIKNGIGIKVKYSVRGSNKSKLEIPQNSNPGNQIIPFNSKEKISESKNLFENL